MRRYASAAAPLSVCRSSPDAGRSTVSDVRRMEADMRVAKMPGERQGWVSAREPRSVSALLTPLDERSLVLEQAVHRVASSNHSSSNVACCALTAWFLLPPWCSGLIHSSKRTPFTQSMDDRAAHATSWASNESNPQTFHLRREHADNRQKVEKKSRELQPCPAA